MGAHNWKDGFPYATFHRPGYVYVARVWPIYKIGMTVNPNGRWKGIPYDGQPGFVRDLLRAGRLPELVHTIHVSDMRSIERAIHLILDKYGLPIPRPSRREADWFKLPKSKVAWLTKLTSKDEPILMELAEQKCLSPRLLGVNLSVNAQKAIQRRISRSARRRD